MIEFSITPSSGHSHSSLDVKFEIKTELKNYTVEIFNTSVNEKLEILSVSSGYIERGKTVVSDKPKIEGYINLFNKDKMNEKLNNYTSVDLKCVVSSDSVEESSVATFFNESRSIDAEVIPFDLIIDNPEIDLSNNIPLSMHIVCDSEQKFELTIRSEGGTNSCVFEVFTKSGRTDILLPSEIIWSDLGLNTKHLVKFHIYWVKFEGMNHMNLMNRKYILIDNSRITFNSSTMEPAPQKRYGPTGSDLPKDFVLSHRYFVPTWKTYSALGGLASAYEPQKMNNMTRFMHEIQRINSMKKSEVQAFGDTENNETEIRKSIRDTVVRKQYRPMDPRQKIVVESFAKPYLKKSVHPTTDRNYVQPFSSKAVPQQSQPRKKGCGCSRKSNV